MELDGVSDKQLQTLERLARELLVALRQAKLNDAPLAESLTQLELKAGQVRRERFDSAHTEFHGY
jgi:hypothetical protein